MSKVGTRLASQVCTTQVIIVKTGDGIDQLRCGGVALIEIGAAASTDVTLDPLFADGTVLGKRYVSESGIEVLATKAGAGSLSVASTPLTLKEAKPLPASD